MSHRTIKRRARDHRVVTREQWEQHYATLDELIRPVVVRVNWAQGLVTVRPKRESEIMEIARARGMEDPPEMVVTAGSIVGKPAVRLEIDDERD